MPIDLNSLGAFNAVASRRGGLESTEIVNLSADGKAVSGGTFQAANLFGRWCRGAEEKSRNNFARTQFLRSLGEALNVGGMARGADGSVTFADDFLGNLKAALGGDPKNVLKLDDFKMKDGQVTSGRPLTERRIAQIVREVRLASFGEGPLARVRLAGMEGAKSAFKTFSAPKGSTLAWYKGLTLEGNGALPGTLIQKMSPARGEKFILLCERLLDANSGKMYLVLPYLAEKMDALEGLEAGDVRNSDLFRAFGGGEVPEGFDAKSPKEVTEALVDALDRKAAEALARVHGADSPMVQSSGQRELVLAVALANATKGMPLDVGIRVAAGDYGGITREHFPAYRTFDPDKAVRLGRAGAEDQFWKDFTRGGVRVTFGDETVAFTDGQYRAGGVDGAPHRTFLGKFDAFTAGMDDRQKLVLAFTISQGGLDLGGLIIGNTGAGVVEHTLAKKDDGSVHLTVLIPKEEGGKPHPRVSYTFEILPDGNGRLVDLKVGGEVDAGV